MLIVRCVLFVLLLFFCAVFVESVLFYVIVCYVCFVVGCWLICAVVRRLLVLVVWRLWCGVCCCLVFVES